VSFTLTPSTVVGGVSSRGLATISYPEVSSVTQIYLIAYSVHEKLSQEAARPERALRLLVGHANTLDVLVQRLAFAEKRHDDYLNALTRGKLRTESKDTAKENETRTISPKYTDRVFKKLGNTWAEEDDDN